MTGPSEASISRAFRRKRRIEDKRIKVVKNWPEPKSMRDIQVLLGCASFYQRFIQGFSKAKPLTSMLRTTTIRSAGNSPLDMAKNAEVGSGTSSTTKSAKNSSVSRTWLKMLRLMVMVMVMMMKQSKDHLFSKKPNVPAGYLIFLRSNADSASFAKR